MGKQVRKPTTKDPFGNAVYTPENDPNLASPLGSGQPGTYVHPLTGATSTAIQDGYVYVPSGYQLQQGDKGRYTVAAPSGRTPRPYGAPFQQYTSPTQVKNMNPDPFDLKIREAALNDLILKRRGATRTSTFTTGPRGVQGPLKTVLG